MLTPNPRPLSPQARQGGGTLNLSIRFVSLKSFANIQAQKEINMRPFRFGILAETMESASQWKESAQRTEALGYSSLLIRDHFVPDFEGNTYAPIAAMSAAALSTKDLRVGTLVLDNDFRHPIVMAKEIATLDAMSDGRLELGLGAGWMESEYQQMGFPYDAPKVRVSRLEEAVTVYKQFFAGACFSFVGQHYQIDNLKPFPASQQKPNPPLLIGAGKERMCKLAGREADIVGLMTSDTRDGRIFVEPQLLLPEALEQKLAWVREGAGARFDELEFNMVASLFITDDRAKTAREIIERTGWDIRVEDVLRMPSRLIGTVEEIIQQIHEQREKFGISYYVLADKYREAFAPIVVELKGK
jgi:probable F420-dependent oxidoreductase